MIRFEIEAPPSLNVQRKWARNIGQAVAFRAKLCLQMREALDKAGVRVSSADRLALATSKERRLVRFTRFFGGRVKELDQSDNFPGACKPVLDELKLVTWRRREFGQMVDREGFGLIFDDAPAYCVAIYDQVRDAGRAGRLQVEVSAA